MHRHLAQGQDRLGRLEKRLTDLGFQLPVRLERGVPCAYLSDPRTKVSVEFWFEPDGIAFGWALSRRKQVDVAEKLRAWIIGPEDFVINKLARPDRAELDEHDVISVLERQRDLGERYLERRAKAVGVIEVLYALRERMRMA